MQAQIAIPHNKLADLCQRHRIQWLALFGSVLRGDFGPASDVDVLVEFEPETRVSYFELVDIQDELSAIFGRPVDVGTPDMLSPFIAQRVMSGLQTIYGDR